MSELSMHELEAEIGEVLPEREALSAIAIGRGNHATQINNHNTTNNVTSHVTTVNANDFSNATAVRLRQHGHLLGPPDRRRERLSLLILTV